MKAKSQAVLQTRGKKSTEIQPNGENRIASSLGPCALALVCACASTSASAQYVAIDLTPPTSTIYQASAEGTGVGGKIQVGAIGATAGGVWMQSHAAIWSSSLDTLVDLTPGTTSFSEAFGTDGSQEAGYVAFFGASQMNHAALWSGTPESFVDLNPPAYADSVAFDCSTGQQVGFGITPTTILGNDSRVTELQGGSHALLWSGTAASVVDLNPAGFQSSLSYGIENGVEVGWGISGRGVTRALRWTGTPESYVDISPMTDFAGNPSRVYRIRGGQTVGMCTKFGAIHGAIWNGPTATDMVDVHPAGYYTSVVRASNGNNQVGAATLGTGLFFGGDFETHAMLWSGTADSALDLHQFLPPGWTSSSATAIGDDGSILVIAGSGYFRNSEHTFLLVPSAPAPCRVASVTVNATEVTMNLTPQNQPIFAGPINGTVTLTSPAPPGDAVVLLFNPDFGQRQSTVTVPEGATSANFVANDPLLVYPADYNWSQKVSASFGGVTKTAQYITLGEFPIFTGPVRQGLVGVIELATPVDADEMVTLGSSDTNLLQVPNQVLLKAGMAWVQYPFIETPTNVDVQVAVFGNCSRGSFSGITVVNGIPAPPPASVSTITPASVPAGSSVALTLSGLNFVVGAQVLVNGVTLPADIMSQSSLTVNVPASALPAPAAASVQVLNPGSTASTPVILTVTGDLPVLNALTPGTVSAGSPTYTITLTGSSFYSSSVAMWQISGGTKTALTTTYVSPTTLIAVVPSAFVAAGGKSQLFVTTPADGNSLASVPVTILPPISLSSISRNTVLAAVPFTMTLKGANFIDGAAVNINGSLVPATLSSSSQMTALIPGSAIPLAGSVPVFAINPGGESSGSITLNLQNPVPRVSSLSPSSVKAGSGTLTLIINGTSFVTTSQARWNGSPIPTTYVSATQVQATVAAANLVKIGTFKIDVQNPNPGGGGSNGLNLSVN